MINKQKKILEMNVCGHGSQVYKNCQEVFTLILKLYVLFNDSLKQIQWSIGIFFAEGGKFFHYIMTVLVIVPTLIQEKLPLGKKIFLYITIIDLINLNISKPGLFVIPIWLVCLGGRSLYKLEFNYSLRMSFLWQFSVGFLPSLRLGIFSKVMNIKDKVSQDMLIKTHHNSFGI